MQKIVCFSGQMANGKTEAAEYLHRRLSGLVNWRTVAFGDAVKDVFASSFNVDRDFIEKWKRNSSPPPGFKKNVRESLMFIGDGFREINPNIWIDILYRNHWEQEYNLLVGDGRYFSEVDSVSDRNGLNVAVWRPGYENDIDHPSEKELKPEIDRLINGMSSSGVVEISDSPFDIFLINDKSLDEFYKTIDDVLCSYMQATGWIEF